ncbi:TPA: hypothetical protein ACWKQH_005200, partial [Escherichia coli]
IHLLSGISGGQLIYLYTLNNSSRSTCNLKYDEYKWNGTWANIFVPYPMRYLPSHLMTCGSRV